MRRRLWLPTNARVSSRTIARTCRRPSGYLCTDLVAERLLRGAAQLVPDLVPAQHALDGGSRHTRLLPGHAQVEDLLRTRLERLDHPENAHDEDRREPGEEMEPDARREDGAEE